MAMAEASRSNPITVWRNVFTSAAPKRKSAVRTSVSCPWARRRANESGGAARGGRGGGGGGGGGSGRKGKTRWGGLSVVVWEASHTHAKLSALRAPRSQIITEPPPPRAW